MALVVGTNTYITVVDADTYFEHSIHAGSWESAVTAIKENALVTATRMLDRQLWIGIKTVSSQDLDWPRSGVSDPEGNAISSASVPQFILDATCELALALIESLSVQTEGDTSTNIKRLKASSAEIEYFKGKSGTRFPVITNELIRYYLDSYNDFSSPYAGGTDIESSLDLHELNGGY